MYNPYSHESKIKSFLVAVGCFLLTLGLLAVSISLFKPKKKEETPIPQGTYTIGYLAVEDKGIVPIYKSLYKSDGNYPTTYTKGEAVYIDELNEIIFVGADEDRTFEGWYLDPKCTMPYEYGTVYTGNLVLYAKLNTGYWTGFY